MIVIKFITIFLWLWLLSKIPDVIATTISYFRTKSIIASITPKKAKQKNLCKGLHSWMSANTWTPKGNIKTNVCKVCGLIEGTDMVASIEALDRIEDNNRILAIEKEIFQEFQIKEDGQIKDYFEEEIKGGLDFQKLIDVHTAGTTFGHRFTLYKMTKSKEAEEQSRKTDS